MAEIAKRLKLSFFLQKNRYYLTARPLFRHHNANLICLNNKQYTASQLDNQIIMGIEEISTVEDSTSYGSTARLNGVISSRKKLFDSLFPKWEMDLYPPGLTKAIAKVERHDFIKNALHRLSKHEQSTPVDMVTGKVKHKHKHHRIGLDRLPISELNDMKDNNVS